MSHRNSASSAKLHPRAQTIWRDKFKQQCRLRLKDARFERMNKNRAGLHISEGDSDVGSSVNHSHISEEDESKMFREIIAAEWEKFKQENLAESAVLMQPDVLEEELMNDLKLMDNDSLYEDMMAYEDNLEESMLRYSMSSSGIERQMYACFQCRSMTMYDTSEGFDCSNCGLKIAVPVCHFTILYSQ
ncbi:hypothetical protein BKA69DRAFT_532827 [Paraphysoderma sedebokerense]|nr:hypothetical protein BKA69DRAFT_532827 [Paraphysoderma sedebokerense]